MMGFGFFWPALTCLLLCETSTTTPTQTTRCVCSLLRPWGAALALVSVECTSVGVSSGQVRAGSGRSFGQVRADRLNPVRWFGFGLTSHEAPGCEAPGRRRVQLASSMTR